MSVIKIQGVTKLYVYGLVISMLTIVLATFRTRYIPPCFITDIIEHQFAFNKMNLQGSTTLERRKSYDNVEMICIPTYVISLYKTRLECCVSSNVIAE